MRADLMNPIGLTIDDQSVSDADAPWLSVGLPLVVHERPAYSFSHQWKGAGAKQHAPEEGSPGALIADA
jgi:hypothetical protein